MKLSAEHRRRIVFAARVLRKNAETLEETARRNVPETIAIAAAAYNAEAFKQAMDLDRPINQQEIWEHLVRGLGLLRQFNEIPTIYFYGHADAYIPADGRLAESKVSVECRAEQEGFFPVFVRSRAAAVARTLSKAAAAESEE